MALSNDGKGLLFAAERSCGSSGAGDVGGTGDVADGVGDDTELAEAVPADCFVSVRGLFGAESCESSRGSSLSGVLLMAGLPLSG